MRLCRQLQREILTKLANANPDSVSEAEFTNDLDEEGTNKLIANMLYLEEHGLISSGIKQIHQNHFTWSGYPRITAKGLDFLADDGGLTAILGTVTIKIHDETLRAMIASRIEDSNLAQPEKSELQKGLQALPAESIKHLTMRLVDKGLESLPAVLPLIQNALQNAL
ncbi:MAG: hypothetical protein AABY68_06020 [Pseudomonadota bacterium]